MRITSEWSWSGEVINVLGINDLLHLIVLLLHVFSYRRLAKMMVLMVFILADFGS